MKLQIIKKYFYILLYFIVVLNLFVFLTYIVSRPINLTLEKYRKINSITQNKIISKIERTKLNESIEEIIYTNSELYNTFIKPMLGEFAL